MPLHGAIDLIFGQDAVDQNLNDLAGQTMKQLNLSMELEASSPPPVVLEPEIRAEVVAQLAQSIITVQQKEKEKTDEACCPAS